MNKAKSLEKITLKLEKHRKKAQVMVRLTPELLERMQKVCKKHGTNRNAYIELALAQQLTYDGF